MQVATAVLAVLGLLLVVAGLTVVALFRDHGGLRVAADNGGSQQLSCLLVRALPSPESRDGGRS